MDLDLTHTPTRCTDDTEFDTPTQSHATMTLSRRRPPPHPETAGDDYKECMKNHAATIGGHAVDGCGEYMSAPSLLTCAACGCHRNFHRREATTAAITPPFLDCRPPPQPKRLDSPPFQYVPPHMLLALTSAVAAEEHHQEPATPSVENLVGKKRFRTKFSQEQKEKMQSFSEKMGWKMQKSNQTAVEEFCHEIGVPKGVLKVWMHNNKNTFGKKEGVINGGKNDVVEEVCRKSDDNGSHFQNESVNHFHDSNNGSSSSP